MTRLTFLENEPAPDRLLRAIVENSRRWLIRWARAGGGEVHRQNGVTWTYTPKADAVGEIAFPRLTEAGADEQLDMILEYYRSRSPLTPVICWSVDPPQPRDLGARLVARGFHWHGRPRWMWLDLNPWRATGPHPGLRPPLALVPRCPPTAGGEGLGARGSACQAPLQPPLLERGGRRPG